MSGSYVFIGIVSAALFGAYYSGYGSWLRARGLGIAIIVTLFLLVILAGRFQVWAYKHLLAKPDTSLTWLTLSSLFFKTCLVAATAWFVSVKIGGELCERRALKVCADCRSLIAELEKERNLTGVYPTNAAALVRANRTLHRRYYSYYGHSTTNGIDWFSDEMVKAHVSLLAMTNRFQCIVPIEKMSLISFSGSYVYSFSSEHPNWTEASLHWSLGGAYIDDPKQ